MEECPCYVKNPPDYLRECTTDCDAEGAIGSANFGIKSDYESKKTP